MTAAVVLLVLAGVGVFVLGVAARMRRLPRNGVAGIRIPATMRSDAAWKAGHRAAAWAIMASALGLFAAAWAVGSHVGAELLGGLAWTIVCALVGALIAHQAARRVA